MPQHVRVMNIWLAWVALSALYAYSFLLIGVQFPSTLDSWCTYPLMCKIVLLNFVTTRVAAQDIWAWTFAWPNNVLHLPGKSMHRDALRAICCLLRALPRRANAIQSWKEVYAKHNWEVARQSQAECLRKSRIEILATVYEDFFSALESLMHW